MQDGAFRAGARASRRSKVLVGSARARVGKRLPPVGARRSEL